MVRIITKCAPPHKNEKCSFSYFVSTQIEIEFLLLMFKKKTFAKDQQDQNLGRGMSLVSFDLCRHHGTSLI